MPNSTALNGNHQPWRVKPQWTYYINKLGLKTSRIYVVVMSNLALKGLFNQCIKQKLYNSSNKLHDVNRPSEKTLWRRQIYMCPEEAIARDPVSQYWLISLAIWPFNKLFSFSKQKKSSRDAYDVYWENSKKSMCFGSIISTNSFNVSKEMI